MAVSFQLVIDCSDPEPLARFWAAALGYELEPPPAGFASWDAYWRDVGVPEDELGTGADRIVDPAGRGPRIWFQVVPECKAAKNRLHLDIGVSGGRAVPIETRRRRVDAGSWIRDAPDDLDEEPSDDPRRTTPVLRNVRCPSCRWRFETAVQPGEDAWCKKCAHTFPVPEKE